MATLIDTLWDGFGRVGSALWGFPEGLATLLGSVLILVSAYFAWRSVQTQIAHERSLEEQRRADRATELRAALGAEMLTYSGPVLALTSSANRRLLDVRAPVPWPRFHRPRVYEAIVGQIGVLGIGWRATTVVEFYAKLLEFDDIASESNAGITSNESEETVGKRLRAMCLYLADALDGLLEREFPVLVDPSLAALTAPSGQRLTDVVPPPKTLYEELRLMGGK